MNLSRASYYLILNSFSYLLYFASFPLLGYGVLIFTQTNIGSLILGLSAILSAIIIQYAINDDIVVAFRRLALVTILPLSLFVLLNIGITATVIIGAGGAIEAFIDSSALTRTLFSGSYEHYVSVIIPRLWMVAAGYAMIAGLFYALSRQVR